MKEKDKQEKLIELGNQIRLLREKKGHNQTQFANLIGKDQPSINRIEKGRINPSYLYLLEIAKGLEIQLNELFI